MRGQEERFGAPQAPRLLVVEDDPDQRRVVAWSLEAAGYEVAEAGSAAEAEEWLARHGLPHLAIIDIVMPGRSGLELAAGICSYSDLPIILLTAVDDVDTVAQSLDQLAEDYIRKPVHTQELVARVGRVLRRISDFSYAGTQLAPIAQDLEIDFVHQRAEVAGRRVALTPTESKLLFVLAVNSPRAVACERLVARLWPDGERFEEALRVHIHRVRHKIEPDPGHPTYLRTVRGVGYVLAPAAGEN